MKDRMIDTVIVSGGMIQKDFALDFIRKIEEERKGKKLLLLAADREMCIRDRIYRIQSITGERVSNVVVMGTGEPMDNYDNIVRFVHLLSDEDGLNISQRNITVSTCGIVPKIYELAKEKLQITLALSLHAPNDEKRQELMPIAQRYSCLLYTSERKLWLYHDPGSENSSSYSEKDESPGKKVDNPSDFQRRWGKASGRAWHDQI